MEADFLARGNDFLPFSQTAVNCCLWKHIFSTGTYFSANLSFRLVRTRFLFTGNSIFLFHVFFCYWKKLLKFEGSQILKTNHIPASGQQFFSIFSRHFLKWKSCSRTVKGHFSISFTWLVQTNFLPMEKVFFCSESFCCY